ncbi:MAG: hypothetical protein J4F37_08045 [Acidobacteria bacterium]|nr:hypothetical protein [Acidobacteriota bacterium]
MTARSACCRLLAAAVAAAAVLAGAEAAGPVFWRVSTQAEFLAGEVENLSVDPAGRLVLGPRTDLVHEAADPFAWALAPVGGALWLGTGGRGRVVRVEADGRAATAFEAAASAVQALAAGDAGRLYAATSPNGRVVALAPDGTATDLFTPSEPYIWALAVEAGGALLVGTGNPGRIYRVTPDGEASLLYDTRATHVLALAVDAQGRILAGTGSPGRVLRIDPQGKAFVLLAAEQDEVTALRVAGDGAVYVAAAAGNRPAAPPAAPPPTGREPVPTVSVTTEVTAVVTTAGTAPVTASAETTPAGGAAVGAVYRIAPDGVWDVVWRSSEDTPYDLAVDGPDAVLIGTGGRGKVFRVSGSPPRTVLLTRAPAQQVTSFAAGPDGDLYYATANPARLYRLSAEPADEGRYLSDVRDAGTVATWGAIRWRARTPGQSSVRLYTRSGNTPTPGETWSDWSEAYTDRDGTQVASPKARYLQWRAALRRGDAPQRADAPLRRADAPLRRADAPALLSVTTAYLPRNLRPEVTAVTVHPPGEAFQETFGSDPPLAGLDRGARDGEGRGGAAPAAQSPTLGRKVFRKGLQTFTWTARDGNQDRLRFDLGYRPEDAPDWRVLAQDLAGTIFTWDTTAVPDGTYEVRVEATDALSNPPGGALTGLLASMPFDIDNTPPEIAIDAAREEESGATLVTFTVRDTHSPVRRVEYAASPGRWQVVHPVDGVPDSREERFEVTVPVEQARGLIVRAADGMGNATTVVAP